MRRREFIALVGGAAVGWPVATSAQQPAKIARIGYLSINLAGSPLVEAFRQGLRGLGYVEGRNVMIEYRDAEGKFERLPALAAELVALKVDVILARGTHHALATKQATRTLPIVFAGAADPVTDGLVTNFGDRAAMSRGCPPFPRSSSASVWNCSRRLFRGSAGSLSPSSSRRSSSSSSTSRPRKHSGITVPPTLLARADEVIE